MQSLLSQKLTKFIEAHLSKFYYIYGKGVWIWQMNNETRSNKKFCMSANQTTIEISSKKADKDEFSIRIFIVLFRKIFAGSWNNFNRSALFGLGLKRLVLQTKRINPSLRFKKILE